MKTKIFYVEDDKTLSFITKECLETYGFEVSHYDNGQDAVNNIQMPQPDIYLLDIMLPKVDGFAIAEKIRKIDTETPILFISAKSMIDDKIKGLKLGADDYITKPYNIEELVLRINVFLKRSNNIKPITKTIICVGDMTVDFLNLSLSFPNSIQTLTEREAQLLKLFLDNKNELITREEILEKVWGSNDYFLGRSLDVFISRLRKYLKEEKSIQIKNRHGVGFVMNIKE